MGTEEIPRHRAWNLDGKPLMDGYGYLRVIAGKINVFNAEIISLSFQIARIPGFKKIADAAYSPHDGIAASGRNGFRHYSEPDGDNRTKDIAALHAHQMPAGKMRQFVRNNSGNFVIGLCKI